MTAHWQSAAIRSGANSADPVVDKPTGTVDGDLLIAVGCCSVSDTITAPAGWTQLAASQAAYSKAWWKIASGEPANYTWLVSGALAASVVSIDRWTGHDPTTPIDVASGTTTVGGSLDIVIPSVSPSGSDNALAQIVARLVNTSYTPPGTATERRDAPAAPNNLATAAGDEVVGSGATGTRTWTPGLSTGLAHGYMIAINPAAPGAGSFSGAYNFAGSGWSGQEGPGEGLFSGAYDFAGSGWTGEAPGISSGQFAGTYDFAGSGWTGEAPPPPPPVTRPPVTAGGRLRFRGRRSR